LVGIFAEWIDPRRATSVAPGFVCSVFLSLHNTLKKTIFFAILGYHIKHIAIALRKFRFFLNGSVYGITLSGSCYYRSYQ
jgi:hypothetical protein